jgi:hypothetical protein
MTLPANIRVNMQVPFPALVTGLGPITVTKDNGVWQIGYDGSLLGVINVAPPLTGGPIDLSGGGGTIGLAPSGVVAGSYTNTDLTVDTFGRITHAATGAAGGGMAIVPTIAALTTLAVANKIALVSDPIREGIFVWQPTNHAVQVTADPGQGIFVASSTDPTGSIGAWVRIYDGRPNLAWWGGIGDGTTDNALALAMFGHWGRYEASIAGGVELYVPPGKYLFNNATNFPQPGTPSLTGCNGCFFNLGKFTLYCAGTEWTNIQNDGLTAWPFPTFTQAIRDALGNSTGHLIATTHRGDNFFTFANIADTALVSVGEVVALMSLDVQGYGFPGNGQWFEWVTINAIDTGTGKVTINELIRYEHRSDYPDFNADWPCGKARMWKLTTGGGWQAANGSGGYFPELLTINWDIDYHIVGPLKVNVPPFGGSTLAQTYQTISGRFVSTYGWNGPGFSESVADRVVHNHAVMTTQALPDKMVTSLSYLNCRSTVTGSASVGFQNPYDFVYMENCNFPSVATGTIKNFRAVNCEFDNFGFGFIAYGLSSSQVLENCRVFNWATATSASPLFEGMPSPTNIDGTNVSYAGGVFTILKSGIGFWSNVVPGGNLFFGAPGAGFPGDIGVLRILSTTEDATHVFITTDGPPTKPSWATSFYICQLMETKVINCTGCDRVRWLSQASAKGFQSFEYFRFVIESLTAALGSYQLGGNGTITKITVNVFKAAPVTGAWQFTISTFDPGNNFVQDPGIGGINVTINAGIAGKRVITQTASSGFQSGETVTLGLGSNIITALPTNRLAASQVSIFAPAPVTATAQSAPGVEFIIEKDCGQVRLEVPVQFGNDNSPWINIQGRLP